MRLFLILLLALSMPAWASKAFGLPFMPLGRQVLPPLGFSVLCDHDPGFCGVSGALKVALTDALRAQLAQTDSEVNAAIIPRNDPGIDTWTVNPAFGDCEDYALTKRERLMELGWPRAALLIAVALTSDGTGHAVLDVVTTEGDIILDNLTPKPMPWYALPYTWQMRMSQTATGEWMRIR